MKKLLQDMLQTNGKWSFKRVTGIYVLNIAIIYAFMSLIVKDFNVLEFVFWGFISYSGTMVGMTLWQKKNVEQPNKEEEE